MENKKSNSGCGASGGLGLGRRDQLELDLGSRTVVDLRYPCFDLIRSELGDHAYHCMD